MVKELTKLNLVETISLGINLIWAKSPQAKGKIERLWETLQSRLPVELNLAGISTLEEANAFLATFVQQYNRKFAREPRDPQSAFRPLEENINLDFILCRKETRKVDNGSTFSFSGVKYRAIDQGKVVALVPHSTVTVLHSPRFGVKVQYHGTVYDVEPLETLRREQAVSRQKKQLPKTTIPAENHPWRNSAPPVPVSYEESDREILEALYSSRLAWR